MWRECERDQRCDREQNGCEARLPMRAVISTLVASQRMARQCLPLLTAPDADEAEVTLQRLPPIVQERHVALSPRKVRSPPTITGSGSSMLPLTISKTICF